MGNEIKEGMTVIVVSTQPFFSVIRVPALSKDGDVIYKTVKMPEKIFEPGPEYRIVKRDNMLLYEKNISGVTWRLDMSMLLNQPGDMLTIKGVSDINPRSNPDN